MAGKYRIEVLVSGDDPDKALESLRGRQFGPAAKKIESLIGVIKDHIQTQGESSFFLSGSVGDGVSVKVHYLQSKPTEPTPVVGLPYQWSPTEMVSINTPNTVVAVNSADAPPADPKDAPG